MVVGVQEGQFLLLDHQEHRVDKLAELGQVVQVVQGDQLLGPCSWVTDGVEQTVVPNHRHELFHHQRQQSQRHGGEEQVVDLEQTI